MLEQSSLPFPAPETWRAIPGFDGRYEVSDQGRVRSLRFRGWNSNGPFDRLRGEPLILRPAWRRGYPQVSLGKDYRGAIHRFVLTAFVGPCPPGHEGAHLNGERADARLVNLAWKTHVENERDKVAHGTQPVGDQHAARLRPSYLPRGENHSQATLTEALVIELRAGFDRGERICVLMARHGLGRCAVTKAVRRVTWRHVP
jgi:hypothetical protein